MSSRQSDFLSYAYKIIDNLLDKEKQFSESEYVNPKKLSSHLSLSLGNQENEADLFSAISEIIKFTPETGSPKFFNQLFAGKDMPSLAGDLIATALNNSMYTYKAAGAQILVENAVIGKMLDKAGMNGGEGTLVPGGSLSNLTATIAAINYINPNHRNSGHDGKKYIAYTSEECHYSLRKNMGILGLGRDNMRYVKADSEGKMLASALKNNIEQDLSQGNIPFMVVATSGTTVRGAFDNLKSIGKVAKSYKLWYHVDGAFGGSLLLNDSYKHYFDGLELADSLTWDAHKMLGTPLLASAILFRKPGCLKTIYSESADYLFQTEEDNYNPGHQSLQCGRRNDALKIWTAWKYHGDEGYSNRIAKQISLANYAASRINSLEGYELIFKPSSINVCFNYKDISPVEICNNLDRNGLDKIGYGTSGGKKFIRLVTANPEISNSDIDRLLKNIEDTANQIEKG